MGAPTAIGAPAPAGEPTDAIGRYLDMLAHVRKLADHTLDNYRRDLDTLTRLARDGGGLALAALRHHDIRGFAARLHGAGLAPASIARTLSAWRGFFDWYARQPDGPAMNPARGVRAPKRARRLPKALAVEHAVALAETLPDSRTALRDHAICELFYSSGLRLSELVQLDWRHVDADGHRSTGWLDLDAAEVSVLGKGGKFRTVPVGARACEALRDWLAVRDTLTAAPADPHALFISRQGKRLSPRAVQLRVKAVALAAGIPADVHPHVLRHSFASHVLQSSGDLRAVQDMLGHASIATTQVYTALDFQHLAKVYDAAHPRAKRKD